MGEENHTSVAEFIFLGLSQDSQTQILLFILFLIIYLLTVLGNLLIIILILTDSQLHTPMYFFLRNLSFADLFLYQHCPSSVGPLPGEEENDFFRGLYDTGHCLPSGRVYRMRSAGSDVL